MKRLLFDLETNGLLDEVHTIHCGVTLDLDSHKLRSWGPAEIPELVAELVTADILAGHNICGYDMLVLEKLHGVDVSKHLYLDTLAMSRALYPGSLATSQLKMQDFKLRRKYGDDAMPGKLVGRHSLMAWSHRLRLGTAGKAQYDGGWEKWTPELQAYCEQDVRSNLRVLNYMLGKGWPKEVFHLESAMSYYLYKQQEFGVGFDESAAVSLVGELVEKRGVLGRVLADEFPPEEVPDGKPYVAKRSMESRKHKPGEPGYFKRVKGETYQKTKVIDFNPDSDPQVGRRLVAACGWKPQTYTKGGVPSTTDDILRDLPWPIAQKIADFRTISGILGYITTGKTAWLQFVKNDRIHGRISSCGAVTSRASHASPNLANVPKEPKPYGKECRALFRAGGGVVPEDWVLVGCDASSLQLAIYAHFVSRFDGGMLSQLVETGDPHEYMRECSGLFTRERQKTLTYAKWFGAAYYKLGTIVLTDWREALEQGITDKPVPPLSRAAVLGKSVDTRMRQNMKGYSDMLRLLETAGRRGFIYALDKRRIVVPQQRLALLTLLQGNEAVVMKTAFVLAHQRLAAEIKRGLCHPMLWVHDEFQWASVRHNADTVGRVLSECITQAGVDLGMSLRLGAKYKAGETWAETH